MDTTDETIRPALTAEEWDEVRGSLSGDDAKRYAAARDYWGGSATPRPHAGAAIALHGQPFGFTWQDVADEIEAARQCDALADLEEQGAPEATGENDEARARAERHWDRAARIAALLPPREEGQ